MSWTRYCSTEADVPVFAISVLQNDIIDCDISDSYPVGFTDCNTHYNKDNIAQVDCGTAAIDIQNIVT